MVVSMQRWEGQVAIVTGASAGIGAAICKSLVEAGLKVVGLARRKERIDELSNQLQNQPGKLYAIKCDIRVESEIIKAIEWTTENLGPISILINNAGVAKQVNLIKSPTEDFKYVWDINVTGLCIATREVCKNMLDNKIDGHIIHISSIASQKIIRAEGGVYSSSKHAVRALTEALRLEFNSIESKIKITSICPGVVDTEILSTIPDDMREQLPKLKPEDVADSVVYVLSTPPGVQISELTIKPTGEPF